MFSGLAAAAEIDKQLRNLLPENGDFFDFFDKSV
jgi:hypothetical protein